LPVADNLVIVESPAKAKTIKKYLGKDFEVLASYGHVRDLIPKEGAVDPDRGFAMQYRVLEKNERHIEAISRALKKAKSLYLATDPDREGEAIAWHLSEILKERGELDDKTVHRVAFYEITRNAVRDAVAQPRTLSAELVNAQQARRALDYLVGFNLSPLLWKKVRQGLSAGRVQSPALRMICEREEEIQAFKPQEYWTLDGEGEHSAQRFPLKLVEFGGTRVEQFSFTNETQAREVERTIQQSSHGSLQVFEIERKQRRRNPAPPFTTSTLQQEAARKLGFNARRTMRLAQQLYEVWTSAKAPSASSPTCVPIPCRSHRKPCERSAKSPRNSTAPRKWRKSRASTRPSRRTPRKRTRPSARLPPRSCRRTSKASSTTICSASIRSSGSARSRAR
jgi:DNA topoisomerase-1